MYCKSCGKIIDDDSWFCNYCGAKHRITAAKESSEKNQVADEKSILERKVESHYKERTVENKREKINAPKKRAGSSNALLFVFIGLVVVLLIWYFINERREKENRTKTYSENVEDDIEKEEKDVRQAELQSNISGTWELTFEQGPGGESITITVNQNGSNIKIITLNPEDGSHFATWDGKYTNGYLKAKSKFNFSDGYFHSFSDIVMEGKISDDGKIYGTFKGTTLSKSKANPKGVSDYIDKEFIMWR